MAKSLGMSDWCRFDASREHVLDFYAVADIYVSLSREDSFGLPVLEAMACGLPVITSAYAGVTGLLQNGVNGFVLREPRAQKELVPLLDELFHDPQRRQRVGKAAAASALDCDWDRNPPAFWQLLLPTLSR